MAFSYQNYTGDNSTTTFSIPFTYTDTSEISVTVDGVAETGLTFPSTSQVTLTSAPASDTIVQVRRTTDLLTRAVDFASGSVLTEEDLDNSNIQVFHAAQETTDIADDSISLGGDDKWDAKSKVIKNVATPINTADATNKAYVDQIEIDALAAQVAAEAAQVAAETAETNAVASAATATTKASEASTSATNSAASAVASSNSASSSATSATASAGSATAAATSASAASVSEANASTSETNASTSETNAASSASSASTSATTATTQAGIATTQATNSSNSATASANSATASANSATDSANSATASANSATAAASSASAASTSETNAANSAAAAASAYDTFDDRYLGSKASDPTVDNDGNALVTGALYFNNTSNEMRVYDGANWIPASSAGAVSLILYEYTATSGQTTFSGSDDNAATLSYSVGNIQVVMNGVILDPSDFTATSGTSVVLASGAATGDLLNIYAFKSFTVADTVSASAGGTFAADVTITGAFTSQGIDDNATSTAMTLDSSGNLLVGTTDTTLYNNTSGTGVCYRNGASLDVLSASDNALILNRTGSDGQIAEFRKSGAIVGSISVTGSSTAYNTSSDYRLKENVTYDWDATTRLKQLKPARFNFIADPDTTVDGFLAHECSAVPEAISGEKDAMRDEEYEVTSAVLDDDGNVVTEAVMGTRSVPDYQGIDQSKLVPLLVKTIQELEARITALEAE